MVEYLWESHGAPGHARERVVPTGTLELVVSLVDGRGRIYSADGTVQSVSGAMVSGAYRRPFTFDTHDHASVVGAHLRPGYAGLVLGVPPSKLVDRHVDLDALWGGRAHELREQLRATITTEERFRILEETLISRLSDRRVHPTVPYALEALAHPQARVASIAKSAGISQRTLIEHFTSAVGLTPKRFGRIVRFHRAAALARSGPFDWARVAHESGYYDQAHLIHDFRELAEVTPSDLARASTHVKEHHQLAVLDG